MIGGIPPTPTATPEPEPTPTPESGGTIFGQVTNSSDGSPIKRATVSVETGQSDLTDRNGNYLIANIPIGERLVTASAKRFKSQTKSVVVSEIVDTIVDFALEPEAKATGKPSSQTGIAHAAEVKARHEANFFQIKGVVGTGVSLSEKGMPIIEMAAGLA